MSRLNSFRDLRVYFDLSYDSCGKMLQRLQQSLSEWRGSTKTENSIHESIAEYGRSKKGIEWYLVENITFDILTTFPEETSQTDQNGFRNPQPITHNPQPY